MTHINENNPTAETIITVDELSQHLTDNSIPIETWDGKEGTKTVADLCHEINEGETELDTDENGELVRITNVVVADIYYQDPTTGKIYRLREDRQVFNSDGSVKIRPHLKGAMAEKTKTNENPYDSVVRGIQEELGVESDYAIFDQDIVEERRETETYPGMNTIYRLNTIPIIFGGNAFNPNGYIEEQEEKTIYFEWEEVELDTIPVFNETE